jgi:regulator of PEP synthase PpsR (kinase-PPPase family)
LENCRFEIQQAESLMRQSGVFCLDVTTMSVEEIATTILFQAGLKR